MKYSRFIPLLIPIILQANPEKSGWDLLYNNQPEEALKYFQNSKSGDPVKNASLIRGEMTVLEYLGETDDLGALYAQSYSLDNDPVLLSSNTRSLLHWSRTGKTSDDRAILKQLYKAREKSDIFAPLINEQIILKQMALGKIKKANKINSATGLIKQWSFIGPFENSAGSGFNTIYPPELEINVDTLYEGKQRNLVSWSSLKQETPDPWIWLNNHSEGSNSTYYFATTISSPDDQEGYLTFGASASFKIFQNGNLITEDSLFRNTGLNSFLMPITLSKGLNTFLIKLGYEQVKANFAMGILDTAFKPFTNTRELTEVVEKRDTVQRQVDNNALMIDSIHTVLSNRISNDSTDLEAVSLLISLLSIHDHSEKAEVIIKEYLKKYPASGYLLSQLGAIYVRQSRITEATQLFKKAYQLSPEGATQWNYEMNRLLAEGNSSSLHTFLDKSSERLQNSFDAKTTRMALYAQDGKIAQAMQLLDTIAQNYSSNPQAAIILHKIYAEGGQSQDATTVLANCMKKNKNDNIIPYVLAEYYVKSGKSKEALDTYLDLIEHHPLSPRSYYMVATLFTAHKQYSEALPYIEKTIELTPNSSMAYRLKGQILQQLSRSADAIECYEKAISVTNDDFVAWESLRDLQGKPSWDALAPLPDIDSVLAEALPWADSIGDPVSVLSYLEDIYRYPSKAIRRRTFFMIHLADRNSIEEWQEYTIGYNGRSDVLKVLNAATIKSDGSRVPADRNHNHIVFKTLEPGDNILVEYTIEEHQSAGMAGMLYGEQEFHSSLPNYYHALRLISPKDDTIPFKISGIIDSVKSDEYDDFHITTISTQMEEGGVKNESFRPSDYHGNRKVIYSDFNNWNEIAQWYLHLTARKGEENSAINAVADSLFTGITDPWEKIRRTHHYITKNIAYSFVSFRQSGWIPQGTGEILATRIGDCKDMALLGRTLLRLGGVEANLVLVNTGLADYIDQAFIGPNFDHAILSATVEDSTTYIDLTSSNSALGTLPLPDQGAMALMVTDSADTTFTLPLDSPEERRVSRNMDIVLHDDGSVTVSMKSEKHSIFATSMRNTYRFSSEKERIKHMQEILQEENSNTTVDSLKFSNLDSLDKSVKYETYYRVDNGVSIGANTALYKVKVPDLIQSSYFPSIAKRITPISLRSFYRSISHLNGNISITYPKSWKLTNKLQNQVYNTDRGSYSLEFNHRGNRIEMKRNVKMNLSGDFTVEEFRPEHEFLSNALLSDNIELIFTK